MPLIRPFTGLRPNLPFTAQVIAPPYDVVTAEEARSIASGKPWNFLHISRPEIDLPPETDPYSKAVYAKGKENFQRQIKEGILNRDPEPYYYLYRLRMGRHTQTGLVAAASVQAYERNRIRKHEHTRPDKEDDRVRQIDELNAQTGPVFLTYRHSDIIDSLAKSIAAYAPEVDETAQDGVGHRLWIIRNRTQISQITQAFEELDCLYIADGHHRSAAAARVAASRRAANSSHTGDEAYNYFLAVIFPDHQMQILAYNRMIKDLKGLSQEQFLDKVGEAFDVKPETFPVEPIRGAEFGMYLPGQWYRISIHRDRIPEQDPVRRLDVSLLADHLIEPILGIFDPRRDKRIDFLGGIRGLKELMHRVNSGEMAVGFSMVPTTLSDLMAVSDAGQVMPPKSTWFEPKLADGLVSHVLD